MNEKTVKIQITEEQNEVYEEADRQIKSTYGFSPGAGFLMALSLSKDGKDEIVGDFSEMIRENARKKKNPGNGE